MPCNDDDDDDACRRACLSAYRQIGNAIAPPVAAALGRCIGLAAAGAVPQNAKAVGHEVGD
jgi:site-specific DNA-cytosine methylase